MLKALDFCCGAGGLTRGLLDAGIAVAAGIDNAPRRQETYKANNAPARFITADLADLNIHDLRARTGIAATDQVLYTAGPPCQPFSTLNAVKGADARSSLLLTFGKLISASPPDFILVENVPGLVGNRGQAVHHEFLAILKRNGFRWDAARLDAKDYGVPQTRKRFILLASRHGQPTLPLPTAIPGEYATVRDAIGHYPPLADGDTCPDYLNHTSRKLPEHHKRIVAAVRRDGGSRKDIADPSLLLPCHRRQPTVHRDVFGRMAWDLPGPTITTRCADVQCGRFIHPQQDRGISLREAAALQTFPDNYRCLSPSLPEMARQIGNAVPVRLAQVLGQAIVKMAHS